MSKPTDEQFDHSIEDNCLRWSTIGNRRYSV